VRSESREHAVTHWARGFLVAVLALAACGCTQTLRSEQADRGDRVDVDAFLHEHLQQQPMVTVAEACRAMVLLADGEDRFTSFPEREASLVSRGILRPEWKLERDACIDKGSVAYMTCRILKIRGGINYNLLGRLGVGDRRYAVRELVYMELMPSASVHRYMTGGELVDLCLKADRYMASHGHYPEESTEPAELLAAPR
jgi:hypothetical protein